MYKFFCINVHRLIMDIDTEKQKTTIVIAMIHIYGLPPLPPRSVSLSFRTVSMCLHFGVPVVLWVRGFVLFVCLFVGSCVCMCMTLCVCVSVFVCVSVC